MGNRVIAYIPLMYGSEYLEACIKSMENCVEKIMVIYSPIGSQGHRTNIECPEKESDLKEIALKASSKVEWHVGYFPHEGAHRDWIYKHTGGYDVMITADSDEVFDEEDLKKAIEFVANGDKRMYGVDGFINFWRSFNHVVLDGFRPYRFVNLKQPALTYGEVKCKIYHFGCCQKEEIVRFKWNVSGHKHELRHNWIDDVYLAWSPSNNIPDLHPVARNLWNAAEYDKQTLPDILKNHVNFNKEVV